RHRAVQVLRRAGRGEQRRRVLQAGQDHAVADVAAPLVAAGVLPLAVGGAPRVWSGRDPRGGGRPGLGGPAVDVPQDAGAAVRGDDVRPARARAGQTLERQLAGLDARLGVVERLLAPTVVGRDLQLGGGRGGEGQAQEREQHEGHDREDEGEPRLPAVAACGSVRALLFRHGSATLLEVGAAVSSVAWHPSPSRQRYWPPTAYAMSASRGEICVVSSPRTRWPPSPGAIVSPWRFCAVTRADSVTWTWYTSVL